MCVEVRREYPLNWLTPASAADFASAALMTALGPTDWQISQDAEEAVVQTIESLWTTLGDDRPETSAFVTVTVHAGHVSLTVELDDARWVPEQLRLRPRRPFQTAVDCSLESATPPAPRPVLWPALALPRQEKSWADTFAALSAVTQVTRAGVADLDTTLKAIAIGVVQATPFTVSSVNLIRPDGDYECVAVAGPESLAEKLLSKVEPASRWDALHAAAVSWDSSIRYLSETEQPAEADEMTFWVPPDPGIEGPDGWNIQDVLYAELTGRDGELLGVLSVDSPADGLRPGIDDLERLEVFADHAASAIERSRAIR